MLAAKLFDDIELLQQRHDLMIELYRIDQARDRARARHEDEALSKLDGYRHRITQSLARLPA